MTARNVWNDPRVSYLSQATTKKERMRRVGPQGASKLNENLIENYKKIDFD